MSDTTLLSDCERPELKIGINFEMPEDSNVHVITAESANLCGKGALETLPSSVAVKPDTTDFVINGDGVFLVYNATQSDYSFVITLPEGNTCVDCHGTAYPMTWYTTDTDCTMEEVNTFVIHPPPGQWLGAFRITKGPTQRTQLKVKGASWMDIPIDPHPCPYPENFLLIGLPIRGESDAEVWRCGQGFEGGLTHFGMYSTHSVDFECEEGTLVTAVLDGVVKTVLDKHNRAGGHINHLFTGYNEIVVVHADGSQACYLHLQQGSARVKKGDKVEKGQVIAQTGSVGFAPWPHIHFQLNVTSKEEDDEGGIAETVAFAFESKDPSKPAFIPVAGYDYTIEGRV